MGHGFYTCAQEGIIAQGAVRQVGEGDASNVCRKVGGVGHYIWTWLVEGNGGYGVQARCKGVDPVLAGRVSR